MALKKEVQEKSKNSRKVLKISLIVVLILLLSFAIFWVVKGDSLFQQRIKETKQVSIGYETAQATQVATGTSGTTTWTLDSNGNLVVKPTSGNEGTMANLANNNTSAPWYEYREQIKTVKFTGTIHSGTRCRGLFNGCTNLTNANFTNFDTSNVITMQEMFYNCSSLTNLDLSGFDTSKVTTMRSMFYGCTKLTDVNFANFDTSNVTDMSCMFQNCTSLKSLDVSSFNTKNVTTMSKMFSSCSSLTKLDLGNFETAEAVKLENISNMFVNCSNLKELNLSKFDTSNATNMEGMFNACLSLRKIAFGQGYIFKINAWSGSFGRGTWRREEDGKEYSVIEINEMASNGNAQGTYTKISNISKEMNIKFPVTYRIEPLKKISSFSTSDSDTFEMIDNKKIIAKNIPVAKDASADEETDYKVNGMVEVKFDDVVTDKNDNKYDLKMTIDNIHIYDLKYAGGADTVIETILVTTAEGMGFNNFTYKNEEDLASGNRTTSRW